MNQITPPPKIEIIPGSAPFSVTPPSLVISKTHSGNFTQGQNGATYNITVSVSAGPTSGTGAPSYRLLVAADIPSLSYVTSVALALPASVFSISGSLQKRFSPLPFLVSPFHRWSRNWQNPNEF